MFNVGDKIILDCKNSLVNIMREYNGETAIITDIRTTEGIELPYEIEFTDQTKFYNLRWYVSEMDMIKSERESRELNTGKIQDLF